MFRKKNPPPPRKPSGGGLSQFGLLDVPGLNDFENIADGDQDDDNDDDLEAELLALTSGKSPKRPKRAKPQPPQVDLDAMVAASLKDIPSDEEMSGDEDDPELLNELDALTVDSPTKEPTATSPIIHPTKSENSLVNILEDRLKMYQEAEQNAKSSGEISRARRFNRGMKTINDQLKAARAGRAVAEEDIPPPVALGTKKPSAPTSEETTPEQPTAPEILKASRPAPPPPPTPVPVANDPPLILPTTEEASIPAAPNNETVMRLKARQTEYKRAALEAKRAGDMDTAMNHIKVSKMFEPVIAAAEAGETIDLSDMPPPPDQAQNFVIPTQPAKKENAEAQNQADVGNDEVAPRQTPAASVIPSEPPPPPKTIREALEQRLTRFREAEMQAKNESNSSKARRYGRIVKQYEQALKAYLAGKTIDYEELPTPPGFGPIPVPGASSAPPTPTLPPKPVTPPESVEDSEPKPPPPPPRRRAPSPPSSTTTPTRTTPPSGNKGTLTLTRADKQHADLKMRQKVFREAALAAKQRGDVSGAKEYLRLAKGFDPLIQASLAGLPVDMATIPLPPSVSSGLATDFDFVSEADCMEGSHDEIYERLETDLLNQARICLDTRDHLRATGDVAGANRFEHLAVDCKRDLETVRAFKRAGDPPPRFHYEPKVFDIVQCCTDLGDNDLELTIIQGINYNVPNPKEVDTYVKWEFAYPAESPQYDKTVLVKDTNNPQYNATFMVSIHRQVRVCQRYFKRHGFKMEVWSRGGFLRSDTLIGTATVKISALETHCILHESFDLMDGRKAVGGKLEVKLRVRNPIVVKEMQRIKEKWLILHPNPVPST